MSTLPKRRQVANDPQGYGLASGNACTRHMSPATAWCGVHPHPVLSTLTKSSVPPPSVLYRWTRLDGSHSGRLSSATLAEHTLPSAITSIRMPIPRSGVLTHGAADRTCRPRTAHVDQGLHMSTNDRTCRPRTAKDKVRGLLDRSDRGARWAHWRELGSRGGWQPLHVIIEQPLHLQHRVAHQKLAL